MINSGYVSRYEWAKKVFDILGVRKFIYPVSKDIFKLPAKGPKFSVMSNDIIKRALNVEIPTWEKELQKLVK